jgi:hypothetical protein
MRAGLSVDKATMDSGLEIFFAANQRDDSFTRFCSPTTQRTPLERPYDAAPVAAGMGRAPPGNGRTTHARLRLLLLRCEARAIKLPGREMGRHIGENDATEPVSHSARLTPGREISRAKDGVNARRPGERERKVTCQRSLGCDEANGQRISMYGDTLILEATLQWRQGSWQPMVRTTRRS